MFFLVRPWARPTVLSSRKLSSFHESPHFWEQEKIRGPNSVNMMTDIIMDVVFGQTSNSAWADASSWCKNDELFCYSGISFELLHPNDAQLQDNVRYWPPDLLTRNYFAPRHFNWKKQWALPSYLTHILDFMDIPWLGFGFQVVLSSYDSFE